MSSDATFTPRADLLSVLINLGISQNAATRALFYTGNYNADLAAAWVFENEGNSVIHTPFDAAQADFDGAASDEEVVDALQHKMVIVVNMALQMDVGKMAAQVAHAAVGAFRSCVTEDDEAKLDTLSMWDQCGETKIVLKGTDLNHLVELKTQADALGLISYLVEADEGTQVAAGSTTALSILGKNSVVDQVTGSLQLL